MRCVVVSTVACALWAGSAASALAQTTQQCRASLAGALAAGRPATVPDACWRLGSLRLGMSSSEVIAALGAPAVRATSTSSATRDAAHWLYVFRADTVSDLHLHPATHVEVRFVTLALVADRLVAIDNDPPAVIRNTECREPSAANETFVIGGSPEGYRAFERFLGYGIGDRLADATATFGRMPGSNDSGDWHSYLPVPLAFGSDPDTGRIVGVSLATDGDNLPMHGRVRVQVLRDTQSCRIAGLALGL